jgi:hypothetical protein
MIIIEPIRNTCVLTTVSALFPCGEPQGTVLKVNPKPFLFRMVGIKTQINGITLEDKF